MKRTIQILLTAILVLPVLISNARIVVVTQVDNTFSPADISVVVGDTVRWVWTSGFHTTTSADIPAGAATWDSPLSTSVQQFDYKITVEGLYNYVCTPHIDLGMIGTITATAPLGLNENITASSVKVYPNPAQDHTVVMLTAGKSGKGLISIYDLLGNQVNQRDVTIRQGSNNLNISLDNINPGIYFIELKYNDQATIVRRFVKSR